MGTQKDIEFAYNDIDKRWRLCLGDHADITAAFYDGDYTKSLEQAQKDKHDWILEGINFQKGGRILDIGSGWGPMLKTIKERGGKGVGLTLSSSQLYVCKKHSLDARLQDYKTTNIRELGKFNGVVSIGAFEHFCSVEEYLEGKRDEIYSNFFKFCNDVLEDKGRLFLQTMTFGKNVPWGNREPTKKDIEMCSIKSPKKSDERVLAGMRAFFPGAWVPHEGTEYLIKLAKPYFDFIKNSDGRLDYIQTITEWDKKWHAPVKGKLFASMSMLKEGLLKGKEYWAKMQSIKRNDIREVFIRDLFGHQRMFFQKK